MEEEFRIAVFFMFFFDVVRPLFHRIVQTSGILASKNRTKKSKPLETKMEPQEVLVLKYLDSDFFFKMFPCTGAFCWFLRRIWRSSLTLPKSPSHTLRVFAPPKGLLRRCLWYVCGCKHLSSQGLWNWWHEVFPRICPEYMCWIQPLHPVLVTVTFEANEGLKISRSPWSPNLLKCNHPVCWSGNRHHAWGRDPI